MQKLIPFVLMTLNIIVQKSLNHKGILYQRSLERNQTVHLDEEWQENVSFQFPG